MDTVRRWLPWLVVVNLLASVLHCGDNMLFFEQYPEPIWITGPHTVDALWLAATPFLFLGWWLSSHGPKLPSVGAFVFYGVLSLSVLGHYLYAPPSALAFRVNFFILLEAVAAGALIVFSLFVLLRAGRHVRVTGRGDR